MNRPSRKQSKRSYNENESPGPDESDADSVYGTTKQPRKKANKLSTIFDEIDELEKIDFEKEYEHVGPNKRSTPDAGQILTVDVENFMCHRKFHLNLGRHLNFITGRNGSGKM